MKNSTLYRWLLLAIFATFGPNQTFAQENQVEGIGIELAPKIHADATATYRRALEESGIAANQANLIQVANDPDASPLQIQAAIRSLKVSYEHFLSQYGDIIVGINKGIKDMESLYDSVTGKMGKALSQESSSRAGKINRTSSVLDDLAIKITEGRERGEDTSSLESEYALRLQTLSVLEHIQGMEASGDDLVPLYGQLQALLEEYMQSLESSSALVNIAQTVLSEEVELLELADESISIFVMMTSLQEGLEGGGFDSPEGLKSVVDSLPGSRGALGAVFRRFSGKKAGVPGRSFASPRNLTDNIERRAAAVRARKKDATTEALQKRNDS